VRKADNLPLSCAVFTKSGSLNFLEPSGPVQACNGTALPAAAAAAFTISSAKSDDFMAANTNSKSFGYASE